MIDAYKIGVSIAAQNNASGVINTIARDVFGLKTNVIQAQNAMKGLKMAAVGAGMAVAGISLLGVMKAPLEEAKAYQLELTKLKNIGVSDAVVRQADQFAKGMNIAGSAARDNLRFIREATSVFRDAALPESQVLHGAHLAAPVLAKLNMIEKTMNPEEAGKLHQNSLAMLRFIEMAGGLKSPERFNTLANEGFKAIQSSGGNVDWEQYRQFYARAGVSAMHLDPSVLFGKLEPVIGELKGSTAGFALRTAYNRLNGINARGMGPVANELIKAGIWDASKVQLTAEGNIKKFNNGSPFLQSELFSRDPVEFYEKFILPMYNKRKLTDEQRARENALIFGSTGGAMFSQIDRQLPVIKRSVLAQAKALGINDSYENAKKTLQGKEVELQANWQNLMLQLGEGILPLAIAGLTALNPMIKAMADFAGKHPNAIRAMMGALMGIGVVFTVVGTILTVIGAGIALAAIGISGPIVAIGAAFTAGAAALGAVAAVIIGNWGSIKKAVGGFASALGSIAISIIEWIKTLPGRVWRGLTGQGDGSAPEAPNRASMPRKPPVVAPPPPRANRASMSPQKMSFNATVNLDGRQVGHALGAGMPTGGSSYDPRYGNPFVTA